MQDQLLDSVSKYTPKDLAEWKNAIAERKELMIRLRKQKPQLSDETKEKVKAIHEDVKNGKITREQAKDQLKELGIERPERPELPNL